MSANDEQPSGGPQSRIVGLSEASLRRWRELGAKHPVLGFGETMYERDQAAFGSVLGSAIALRLFLFVIPANVTLVGLVNLLRLGALMDRHLNASATTQPIAEALGQLSWSKSLWIVLTGLILTAWAGRSLARVLASSSALAWALSSGSSRVSIRTALMLTGVLLIGIVAGSAFSSIERLGGVAATLGGWFGVFAMVSVVWFAIMLTLPRGTSDPGALLPAAVLFGVGYTVLQWFMQMYVPNRVARTSDTLGELAGTVAALGNFFLMGRLMSLSFVVSAVLYERIGSVSSALFALPGVRAIPRRVPRVATYFALDEAPRRLNEPSGTKGD
ncbi:MAG TPA: hypothetical protein DCR14_05120 [Acidimicrobiaceae bacterium]|nr:hypothetical protein [Acidimicrobiaceae bacterium]